MKKIILAFLLLGLTISCSNADAVATVQSENLSAQAQTLYSGILQPTSGITASGNLKIAFDKNATTLFFENASVEKGPDLKVYLSKTNTPEDFINLGAFSLTTTYTIPENTDLTVYKYVLIHCQQYNHLYVVSQLVKN
jgi:hypothetical protein